MVAHHLLIATCAAYEFDKKTEMCQNVCSEFEEIISGVTHGSLVGVILRNVFLNDSFYTTHNFADDNILSGF